LLSSPPEQSPDRIERALFSPRSILLCGASRDPGRIGGKVLERLRKSFAGRLEILSQHEQVQGARARPTIEGMEPVDVAIVTLRAPDATAAVEELTRARATRAIIVSSSGFADAGATELQARVVEACDRAGVLLVGPNALGTFSAGSGFVSTFATQLDRPGAFPLPDGDVAVVSESGAVAAFIHAGLQDAGIGVRHWAALGNAARTSVAEVLRWYARDDAVKSVIVYVEAASDLVGLTASISSSSGAGQRVIFLTSGESEIGRRAASSHTGRMASNCHVLR
jgi:acyl-CoA synthetase (NDP forming)